VWEVLLEWSAGVLGLTARPRTGQLVVACIVIGCFSLMMLEVWGVAGLLVPGAVIAVVGNAAREVAAARDSLWRAAHLHLDDPRQTPPIASSLSSRPASATTLHNLGVAVNDARRARYDAANDALPRIDRALLRADEARLLDAVRAMISLGLDDAITGAHRAALALPTGSEEIDAHLGRAVIAAAWNKPAQLRVIQADWDSKGIAPDQDGTLARLHRLTRLRIDERLIESVGAVEARALSSEARAVGDEDFAADLEARARDRAYR
jgi:hypothetical protein